MGYSLYFWFGLFTVLILNAQNQVVLVWCSVPSHLPWGVDTRLITPVFLVTFALMFIAESSFLSVRASLKFFPFSEFSRLPKRPFLLSY